MNITTVSLNTLSEIQEAIKNCDNPMSKALLEMLLKSKEKEAELSAKLAAKPATKKAVLDDETILKSVFVALRPHVELTEQAEQAGKAEQAEQADKAVKTFKAACTALNIDFTTELQTWLFGSSSVHCVKSNFNKSTNNISDSYTGYLNSVKQAKKLLPDIKADTWNTWLKAVTEAATRAAKKRGISWTVPAADNKADNKAAAEQAAAEQAAAEQAAAEQAAAEQAAAEQAAAAKKGKKK